MFPAPQPLGEFYLQTFLAELKQQGYTNFVVGGEKGEGRGKQYLACYSLLAQLAAPLLWPACPSCCPPAAACLPISLPSCYSLPACCCYCCRCVVTSLLLSTGLALT